MVKGTEMPKTPEAFLEEKVDYKKLGSCTDFCEA